MINSDNINPKLIDKIINAAYGNAGIAERMIVCWKAFRSEEVKRVLEEYKNTANSVHSIRKEELREYVIESVRKRLEFEDESENLLSKIYFSIFSKPLFSAAVASIFVLAIVSIFIFSQPAITHKYSKAEIELAQKQFEQSLAIVGKVFQNAEKKLDYEVISKHVSKQLNKGLIYLNDYLIGG